MLERPPTVVPANVVPVGKIVCPRKSSPGGFEPSLAVAAPAVSASAIATAAVLRPSITTSWSRGVAPTLRRNRGAVRGVAAPVEIRQLWRYPSTVRDRAQQGR